MATNWRMSVTWLVGLGLTTLLGCNKTTSPTESGPPQPAAAPAAAATGQGQFDVESGPHAAGKKALVAAGCFRCHTVNAVRGPVPAGGGMGGPGGPGRAGGGGMAGGGMGGGRMGPKPPDLGKTGGDPAHTVDWFVEFIRNPKSVKSDARMPAFPESKVNDDDLRAIAEYLASLK